MITYTYKTEMAKEEEFSYILFTKQFLFMIFIFIELNNALPSGLCKGYKYTVHPWLK